jgi:hypothetical protein
VGEEYFTKGDSSAETHVCSIVVNIALSGVNGYERTRAFLMPQVRAPPNQIFISKIIEFRFQSNSTISFSDLQLDPYCNDGSHPVRSSIGIVCNIYLELWLSACYCLFMKS